MRRAAISIPSNVAEGQGVKQSRWSLRHIAIAIGSSLELETQVEAAVRLGFVSRERTRPLAEAIDRVQKLLSGLRRRKLRGGEAAVAAGASAVLLAVIYALAR
jgi:four helix bundle protein